MLKGIIAVQVCKFYYEYHKVGHCRCVDAKTRCSGFEPICNYPIGRLCYEEELKDARNKV